MDSALSPYHSKPRDNSIKRDPETENWLYINTGRRWCGYCAHLLPNEDFLVDGRPLRVCRDCRSDRNGEDPRLQSLYDSLRDTVRTLIARRTDTIRRFQSKVEDALKQIQ